MFLLPNDPPQIRSQPINLSGDVRPLTVLGWLKPRLLWSLEGERGWPGCPTRRAIIREDYDRLYHEEMQPIQKGKASVDRAMDGMPGEEVERETRGDLSVFRP
jgi:hypothetical protein